MDIPYIIGQIIGVLAMATFLISYQCAESEKMLKLQCLAVLEMCVHYLLIGATSGLVLNVVCLLRNLCYSNRDKKFFSWKGLPICFAVAIGGIGLLSWEDYYSIFIVAGLVINTLCLAITDTQKVRYSILVSCPLIFIYDVFVFSIGGMANEALSFLSALIGIVRLRKKDRSN